MVDTIAAGDPLSAARAAFPGALASPYLNVASRGIVAEDSRQAAARIIDEQVTGIGTKEGWAPLLTAARAGFGRLVGAAPAEVAVTRNVSDGINILANALDWRSGDNVVLCPALEHPNNVFIWQALARRGVEMRAVAPRDGDIDAAAMAAAVDRRTRVVTASSVTFTPGFRTDLAPLAEASRKAGAFFLVDGVQSVGVLAMDMPGLGIDGLAVSTSKGLLGVIGLGFLAVRQEWIGRLNPAYVARFSVDLGDAHESEGAASTGITFYPDARRFETGNYNWVGIAAAEMSLRRLNALRPARIESHAVRLAEALRDGLSARGYAVSRPPRGRAPSHIVTLGALGVGSAYATADQRLNDFADRLKAAGVRFSIRRGQLRFGTHVYNDDGDVAAVLALA